MPTIQNFVLVFFLFVNVILSICTLIDLPIHYFRGLGLWEKISHPIDAFFITLSMFLGFQASVQHSSTIFWIYCLLAFITMVLTYKDEAVHQKECPVYEQVIHAIMFSCTGISLSIGAIMIILGIGKSLFLLGFVVGCIFFFVQIVLNYYIRSPKPLVS